MDYFCEDKDTQTDTKNVQEVELTIDEHRLIEQRRQEDARDIEKQRRFLQMKVEMRYFEVMLRRHCREQKNADPRELFGYAADRLKWAQCFAMKVAGITSVTSNLGLGFHMTFIHFRLPKGETHTHCFRRHTSLIAVHAFVSTFYLEGTGITGFTLSSAYPDHRRFTENDDEKSLLQLGLIPAAVLLVVPDQTYAGMPTVISRLLHTVKNFVCNPFQKVLKRHTENPELGLPQLKRPYLVGSSITWTAKNAGQAVFEHQRKKRLRRNKNQSNTHHLNQQSDTEPDNVSNLSISD